MKSEDRVLVLMCAFVCIGKIRMFYIIFNNFNQYIFNSF